MSFLSSLSDKNAEEMPFFLPPALFTRVDSCQDNLFKKEAAKAVEDDSTIIGLSRSRRFKHASYISFSLTGPIPEKPYYQAMRLLEYKFVTKEQFNTVKEVRAILAIDAKSLFTFYSLFFITKNFSILRNNQFGCETPYHTKQE